MKIVTFTQTNLYKRIMAEEVKKEEQVVQTTTPQQTVTTETETITPTSRSKEWMRTKYPDAEWADDAAYDEALATHLADADSALEGYRTGDAALSGIMERDPDFARVMEAVRNGMPFGVALRTYMGDLSQFEPAEGEPDYEAYRKAGDDYVANKKKAEEEIAERNKNLDESDGILESFMTEKGLDETQQEAFLASVMKMFGDIGKGIISHDSLNILYDGLMHDADVAEAHEEGAIQAKNEKISAKRIKEASQTDGLPNGGGSDPAMGEEIEPEENDIFAEIDSYRKRRNL